MNKIKLGILGGGGDSLIGILHRVASNMYDRYQIVGGVFNPNYEENLKFADKIGVDTDRVYIDFDTFIEEEIKKSSEERIEVVSVLTPNFLHFPMAKKKHNAIFAVTYTYTGYPMVRHMKHLIASGALGEIQKTDVQYYQGWINPVIHDPEIRKTVWRLDPKKAGISSCIGDIGTHAFQMTEYLTGMEVKYVLSDLNMLYDDNELDLDGTILIRFSEKVKGVIRASQIATGEENGLTVAVYGKKGAFKWEQENPNILYHITDDEPKRIIKPGHAYVSEVAADGTKLPGGHPEGIFDAMGNIYKGVAKALRDETAFDGEYPTMNDGVRGMLFIEKVVESHKNGNIWLSLERK